MLKLTRRSGETLILETENEKITLHFDLDGKQIKVRIDAPASVNVVRGEVLDGRLNRNHSPAIKEN